MGHCNRALIVATALVVTGTARAEGEIEVRTTAVEGERAALAGALLPWTLAARHTDRRAVIASHAGYDASANEGVLAVAAELTLYDRVTVRGAASTLGSSRLLSPAVGVIIDVLRGRRIDLAVAAEYQTSASLSGVPAMVARVAASTTLGRTRLIANVAFGVGTDTEERHGELNLAATRPVGHGLHAGLDARFHTDLERDDDEPPGEREWDLRLGPIATLPFGRYALTVGAGLTASKLRHAASIDAGAIVLTGLAAVF